MKPTILGKAIEYYVGKEIGLGLRFYAEYRFAFERILAYPDAWYALSGNTRRCRMKVFPATKPQPRRSPAQLQIQTLGVNHPCALVAEVGLAGDEGTAGDFVGDA